MNKVLILLSVLLLTSCLKEGRELSSLPFTTCFDSLRALANSDDKLSISKKIKSDLVEVSQAELSREISSGYLFFRDKIFYGEIQKLSFMNDTNIIRVIDERGRIHLFDGDTQKVRLFSEKKLHQHKETFLHKPHIAKFDRDKFLKSYCFGMTEAKSSREFKELKRIFRKYGIQQTPIKSRFKAMGMCLGGGTATIAGAFLTPAFTSTSREDKDPDEWTYFEKHGSNWMMGIALMLGFHQCATVISPANYQAFLGLAIGIDMAANIMYEVKLSEDFIPLTESKPVETDLNDLTMGFAGAFTYYLMADVLKNYLNVNEAKLCKKYNR